MSFSKYQKQVIAILAFLQFTIILDFMIMSPLGALLMPDLGITPAQFGIVVSAYAFSAGISGLVAAGFADKFDRKKMLLFFYSGFVLGTFLCGLANSYEFLLFARIVTGVFGGVIGSIVYAITTDLFTFELRGRVMGFIQTAFAASQILGLPLGMFISNHWGWEAPFFAIVIISILVGFIILKVLKPIDAHLQHHPDQNAARHLQKTLSNPKYIIAFLATALLGIGGFMMMPFGSAYTVHNLGISMTDLPWMYFITGVVSIFIGPVVGRLSDRFGKFEVFIFGCILTVLMVMIYTHLPPTSWAVVAFVNSLMFIGIFSRMIPSQALMSAVPSPSSRGAFMAISSSLQQISGGIGSVVAGWVVVEGANGRIEHFDQVGYIVSATTFITIYFMYKIHKLIHEKKD